MLLANLVVSAFYLRTWRHLVETAARACQFRTWRKAKCLAYYNEQRLQALHHICQANPGDQRI